MDRNPHRVARAEEAVQAVQGPHRGASRAIRHGSEGDPAVSHVLRGRLRWRHPHHNVRRLRRPLGTRRRRSDAGARDRRRRPGRVRRSLRAGLHRQAMDRQGTRTPDQGDRGRGAAGAQMTTQPAIRVQGIEKSFKDVHVLRGVDFDVTSGSIFALLGSNGAGKTTLVRILSTLLKADAGAASVQGFDVAGKPGDVRESISLTGQFAAVDEVLTGWENLVLVAKLRHLNNPAAIADDLLARFSLTYAGNRRASTYSGGMRRRLDIAMSLIGNPPIIFLDEPTTGLDPQARIEVWQTIKQLAGQGTTVLLTTQYLDEAEQLADRIAILHKGMIIQNGTLTELKQLLLPAKVEYIEKQPSLEDVFLALVGDTRETDTGETGTGGINSGGINTAQNDRVSA